MTPMEHVVEKSGTAGITGASVGGVTSVLGALTLNDLMAIGGFVLAFVSVVFQVWATWYFKSRHLRIAEARLAADLKDRDGSDGDA